MPSKYVRVVSTNSRPATQEHERGQPEGVGRDDAEREVDRRADRAVGGREQPRRADPALDRHERVPARRRAAAACGRDAERLFRRSIAPLIKAPRRRSAPKAGLRAEAARLPGATNGSAGAESMITRQGRLPSTISSVRLEDLPGGPVVRHRHHDRVGSALDRLAHDPVAGLPRRAPSRSCPLIRWPRPAHWRPPR